MDGQRFDQFARVVATVTRRRLLLGLVAGAGGALGLGRAEASAARCRKVGAKCNRRRDCCKGMVCDGGRCACKTEVEPCGRRCCEDCFIAPDTMDACCSAKKICQTAEHGEICCYPDEVCLADECCCDGCAGTKVCGDPPVCCPSAACCGGKCCGVGEVCARKRRNGPRKCVPADQPCEKDGDCSRDETCVGDTCCSGDRLCAREKPGSEADGPVCCSLGKYCDKSGGRDREGCCEVGTLCATFRPVRVRR